MPVTLATDNLNECWPEEFRNERVKVGALLHPASINGSFVHTESVLQKLAADNCFKFSALFGPQHGFHGTTQDNMIEWQSFRHPRLDIPVHSLYGQHREPTADMLDGIDVLFVDLQDVGARYYTFIWSLFLCMRACEKFGVHVVVNDRPNPIGNAVEFENFDPEYSSFVGLHPIPIRHGKTIGQSARQFREEAFHGCGLTVLEMEGWDPAQWHDETGLPWISPSPNMPTLHTATVYPGMCLLEGTNLSEGRGTTRPFEFFGAPWIKSDALCAKLADCELPGVVFRPISFEPTFQKHAQAICEGAQLHITDRQQFVPVNAGIEVIRTVRSLWPEKFAWKQPPYEYETEKLPIEVLLGGPVENVFGEE
ncbi:MAG: DUF1343 domain-containing protein [Verrucomicrobiota bacterium]